MLTWLSNSGIVCTFLLHYLFIKVLYTSAVCPFYYALWGPCLSKGGRPLLYLDHCKPIQLSIINKYDCSCNKEDLYGKFSEKFPNIPTNYASASAAFQKHFAEFVVIQKCYLPTYKSVIGYWLVCGILSNSSTIEEYSISTCEVVTKYLRTS